MERVCDLANAFIFAFQDPLPCHQAVHLPNLASVRGWEPWPQNALHCVINCNPGAFAGQIAFKLVS